LQLLGTKEGVRNGFHCVVRGLDSAATQLAGDHSAGRERGKFKRQRLQGAAATSCWHGAADGSFPHCVAERVLLVVLALLSACRDWGPAYAASGIHGFVNLLGFDSATVTSECSSRGWAVLASPRRIEEVQRA
jgi:hypothetical protein